MNPLADGNMGGLYLGVFRDASHAGLAPPAGLFEPANRQFGASGKCCIDPEPASPDPAGDGQCCVDIAGPDRCRQAIDRIIGQCDGLFWRVVTGGSKSYP